MASKEPLRADALRELTEALRVLPGVGPKSSQRMAHSLLLQHRAGAVRLVQALEHALDRLHPCPQCNTFTELSLCETCSDSDRDPSLLCIVESPADRLMIEQSMAYRGQYFILMGRLSPLDGVGPRELGFDRLFERIRTGAIREVVLATNFTNEGEATAHYLGELLRDAGVTVTRLARGVPVGGELEYVDLATLAQAFVDRR